MGAAEVATFFEDETGGGFTAPAEGGVTDFVRVDGTGGGVTAELGFFRCGMEGGATGGVTGGTRCGMEGGATGEATGGTASREKLAVATSTSARRVSAGIWAASSAARSGRDNMLVRRSASSWEVSNGTPPARGSGTSAGAVEWVEAPTAATLAREGGTVGGDMRDGAAAGTAAGTASTEDTAGKAGGDTTESGGVVTGGRAADSGAVVADVSSRVGKAGGAKRAAGGGTAGAAAGEGAVFFSVGKAGGAAGGEDAEDAASPLVGGDDAVFFRVGKAGGGDAAAATGAGAGAGDRFLRVGKPPAKIPPS